MHCLLFYVHVTYQCINAFTRQISLLIHTVKHLDKGNVMGLKRQSLLERCHGYCPQHDLSGPEGMGAGLIIS